MTIYFIVVTIAIFLFNLKDGYSWMDAVKSILAGAFALLFYNLINRFIIRQK